ncbi:PRC-barrel domain containing protein [Streptomyces sp. NPDC087212]|uniref:PRC-barrel domain containing protein n=1 Tax=Streptomyces sp. NPDC087212 TaxID=3365766 RepID=UPI003816FDA7
MTDGSLWGYAPSAGHTPDADLTGYKVEALDGHIGKVDKHSNDVGAQYLVVDTGPWIFGKEVLLPAGTVAAVDHENEVLRVARTKEQIKGAPEFDKDTHLGDPGYRDQLSGHYGTDGPGH